MPWEVREIGGNERPLISSIYHESAGVFFWTCKISFTGIRRVHHFMRAMIYI